MEQVTNSNEMPAPFRLADDTLVSYKLVYDHIGLSFHRLEGIGGNNWLRQINVMNPDSIDPLIIRTCVNQDEGFDANYRYIRATCSDMSTEWNGLEMRIKYTDHSPGLVPGQIRWLEIHWGGDVWLKSKSFGEGRASLLLRRTDSYSQQELNSLWEMICRTPSIPEMLETAREYYGH